MSIRFRTTFVVAALHVCFVATGWSADHAAANKSAEDRLFSTVKYLASDDLEGRGLETKGIHTAAEYIAAEFRKAGLKTDLYDGGPFQKFELNTGAKLGPDAKNRLVFSGAVVKDAKDQQIKLKLGEDFQTLTAGGSAVLRQLPLVFVGYGITAKDLGYDDYAGVDVKGKAVVILRHEPQQNNPHSKFEGKKPSRHALFRTKISNAIEHGAAAIIFCTSETEIQNGVAHVRKRLDTALAELEKSRAAMAADPEATLAELDKHREIIAKQAAQVVMWAKRMQQAADPLLGMNRAGEGSGGRTIPVLHCRREVIDRIAKGYLGKSLATVEHEIDRDLKPQSQRIGNWSVSGETRVNQTRVAAMNVVGVLEASGPLAEETIVIGAHYDHLGFGGRGSLAAGAHGKQAPKVIHNGADDNASGVAALLEIARRLAAHKDELKRRVVFIAFTGEESGLLGSARYVKDPLVPLDKTIAMLNFDMVGRMKDNQLVIFGTGSASEFDALLTRQIKDRGIKLKKNASGYGPSDQTSFYAKKIPVMHFFTGTHKDYHRPTDDSDKVNARGMRRVVELVEDVALEIAATDKRPTYREVKSPRSIAKAGARPYFGSIPDFSGEGSGYKISGVAGGGPADQGGLKSGDAIVLFGESKITNLDDFDNALRKYKGGDKVKLTVRRGSKDVKLEVTLDPPR
jgi:hypothetical protein